MFKKLRIFLFNKRTWVYNLQYIFYSIIILAIVTYLDYKPSYFSDLVPNFLYTRVELAKLVLSSISSGLLSISIFAFSSILAILTFYSGNFSPRVVENFVGKKITMKVLGIFVGGFTYCITSLNFMTGSDSNRLVLAGTVGIIYVVFCIVYLIIFIQSTIRDVQVVNVVTDIYEETLPVIMKEVKGRDLDIVKEKVVSEKYTNVYSKYTGYFELFNLETAMSTLYDFDGIFLITVKTGDFVVEGQEIGRLIGSSIEDLSQISEDLVSSYEVHENKISITDYLFGIDKIKEIALMALSPGINDPATAIHCIRKISTLLSKLASTDEYHHIRELKNGGYIYYISNEFQEDLHRSISPIANYGKNDAQVISAIFEGMTIISSIATDKNREKVLEFSKEVYEASEDNIELKSDFRYISNYYYKLVDKAK